MVRPSLLSCSARAIRQEYAWVAEDDYRRGRASVLHGFLGRARLFRLERTHERLDVAARRNLRNELAVLGA
jgi:predicted metal-dependent HD superfamily phosphohydrolase